MEDNKKHKILNLYDYLQTENCMLYYDINDISLIVFMIYYFKNSNLRNHKS